MTERKSANERVQDWAKKHPEEANRNFKRAQDAVLSKNREELRNILSEGAEQHAREIVANLPKARRPQE